MMHLKAGLLALALLLCGATFAASGQTNLGTITFTNKTGDVIRNAEVVRVQPDGLIYHFSGGGGGMVKFTNLPPAIRERFGYDPKKAAEAEAAERRRQAALNSEQTAQQQADNWRGPPKRAHVLKVIPSAGFPKYLVEIAGEAREIIILNFPPEAKEYFDDHARLESALQAASRQLERDKAAVPGPLAGRSRAVRVRRARIAEAKKLAADDQKQVSQAQSALTQLQKKEKILTTISLRQTAKKYANTEIWVVSR